MQNGQNPSQLLFKHLTKFGGIKQKIFLTKDLGFYEILYHFILSLTEIFCAMQISQIPTIQRLARDKQPNLFIIFKSHKEIKGLNTGQRNLYKFCGFQSVFIFSLLSKVDE
jgi:hypothetical protein